MTSGFGNIPPFFPVGYFPGGTVPNATTFNSAVTMKETLTINKTAEAGAEAIAKFTVSDVNASNDFLQIENSQAGATTFGAQIRGSNPTSSTVNPLSLVAQVGAGMDTGTTPLMLFWSRLSTNTALSTRVLFGFKNGPNDVLSGLPLNSGANLALSWGTQTGAAPAFTTRSAGQRLILYSAIDGTHVDNALGVTASGAANTYAVQQANSSYSHTFYGGTTAIMTLRGDGLLTTTGGFIKKLRVATTTPITVASSDHYVLSNMASAGAVAVSLTGATPAGMSFTVKDAKGDAAANNITITPTSGTIDGAATLVINTNYGKANVVSDGVNYWTY